MGLLQSQTFTNSCLQFLIILECDKERQISLHQCFRDYVKRGNFSGITERVLTLFLLLIQICGAFVKWETPCIQINFVVCLSVCPPIFDNTVCRNLTFMNPASWYNYENNQQEALYRLIYYSKSALHVSGDVFAHHQKHLTVFTVSGSIHPSSCRLVSWMS